MVHKNSIARSADLRLMRRFHRCSGSATRSPTRLVPASLPSSVWSAKQSASPKCCDRATIECANGFATCCSSDLAADCCRSSEHRVVWFAPKRSTISKCRSRFICEAWLPREFGAAVAQDRSNAARWRCSSVVHPISATDRRAHGSSLGSHHRVDACRSRYTRVFGQRCKHQLFGASMDTDAMVSSRATDRFYACCCYQY